MRIAGAKPLARHCERLPERCIAAPRRLYVRPDTNTAQPNQATPRGLNGPRLGVFRKLVWCAQARRELAALKAAADRAAELEPEMKARSAMSAAGLDFDAVDWQENAMAAVRRRTSD